MEDFVYALMPKAPYFFNRQPDRAAMWSVGPDNDLPGRWLRNKYKRQQIESGTYRAARNLRKQGASLAVALSILVGRV